MVRCEAAKPPKLLNFESVRIDKRLPPRHRRRQPKKCPGPLAGGPRRDSFGTITTVRTGENLPPKKTVASEFLSIFFIPHYI